MNHTSKEFTEGKKAQLAGTPRDDNPYDGMKAGAFRDAWFDWDRGWESAKTPGPSQSDGYMIRYRPRGKDHWESVKDPNGDVRNFPTDSEAHEVKESLELSHREYSYNVYPHDAGAI